MFEQDKFYTIELEHVTGNKLTRWGLINVEGILAYDKLKEALEVPETMVANVYEVNPKTSKSIMVFDFYMLERLSKEIENDKKKDMHKMRNFKTID